MLAITPRPIEKFQLVVSRHEMNQLGLNLMLLPAFVALLGLTVLWLRRS
jgi:hypothetical protein